MSAAKISGVAYAVMGFVFGVLFAGVALLAKETGSGTETLIFGIGAPIALPLMYGGLGFVFAYLTVMVYNFFASKIGGVIIETESINEM